MFAFFNAWFLFLVAHALADFALQTRFMAYGKCVGRCIYGVPWWAVLTAHALVNAGAVYGVALLLGLDQSVALGLGLLELWFHWLVDAARSCDELGAVSDQIMHVAVKMIFAGVVLL